MLFCCHNRASRIILFVIKNLNVQDKVWQFFQRFLELNICLNFGDNWGFNNHASVFRKHRFHCFRKSELLKFHIFMNTIRDREYVDRDCMPRFRTPHLTFSLRL